MSVNEVNLTNRLIQAERELTALKTAHDSGLDNLQIFTQSVKITGVQGKQHRIHVQISDSAPPNPIIQIFPEWGASFHSDAREVRVNTSSAYPDDQRNFYRVLTDNYFGIQFTIYVFSTSDIASIDVVELS